MSTFPWIRSTGRRSAVVGALLLLAVMPAASLADAPANDNRAAAQALDLPASVQGTTQDATTESNERLPLCGPAGPSVWYSLTADSAGRIGVRFDAAGELDATLEVFKSVRSRLDAIACDLSDNQGRAALNFAATSGGHYLVRVSQLPDSQPGTFSLRVSAPVFPAKPPGAPLPAGGATRTLDRIDHIDGAWSIVLHSGVTYRLRLSGRNGHCSPAARVYAPGATSFEDADPVKFLSCGRTLTMTPRPGEGGRYSVHVLASPTARGSQTYHLQLARAGVDDTAPGLRIGNHQTARGSLRGNAVDDVDLYRFTLTDRSRTSFTLTTSQDFRVIVLTGRGRRLGVGAPNVDVTLRPGRYFVAVRAAGSAAGGYRLKRDSRVITRTTLSAAAAGLSATLVSMTSPVSSGPVVMTVERFDPLAGWLFADQFQLRAAAGRASRGFTGLEGLYRVTAQFLGTRDAATSTSRTVEFQLLSG